MAFERSSSADTADFMEGIQITVCAINLAKVYIRISIPYTKIIVKMNCWRNVADKFDMSTEDAEKKSRTFAFFSQRSQRSYGNGLIVRDRQDR